MSKNHAHTYQAWKKDIIALGGGDKFGCFLFFVWFINGVFFEQADFMILEILIELEK